MRVLLAAGIYPPEIGGPATFVPRLARFFQKQGHVVSVVTYGDHHTKSDEEWSVTVISRGRSVLWRYLRYVRQVYRQAMQSDVVFAQGAVSEGFPAAIAAFLARKPFVLRVPGDYAWEQYQQRTSLERVELLDVFVSHRHTGLIRVFEGIERWVAARAVRIIVPSQYLKRILGSWGVTSNRVSVIYNDVDPLPPAQESREVLQARFGFSADARLLFTIARAVPWKGIEFLLSILPQLPENMVLVVAGDGPLLSTWREQIRTQALEHRTIFLGRWPHAELSSWFQAVDAFVLASSYEGFPHVAIEAAMQGLPCVLSDAGGNPEATTLLPGFATIVPTGDREAWIRTLSTSSFARNVPFVPSSHAASQVESLLKDVIQHTHTPSRASL